MNTPRDATERAAVALIEELTEVSTKDQKERELLRQLRGRVERWASTHPPSAEQWRAILEQPRREYPQLVDLLAQLVKGDVVARHLLGSFTIAEPPGVRLRYRDFTIAIEKSGEGVIARLLGTPCGKPCTGAFKLSASCGKTIKIVRSFESRIRKSRDVRPKKATVDASASPNQLGEDLFRALFVDGIRDAWIACMGWLAGNPDFGLRLRLIFDLTSEPIQRLAALPWELLRDPITEETLCKSPRTPVVRSLEVWTSAIEKSPPPKNILLLSSRPIDHDELDLACETRAIEEAWRLVPRLRVEGRSARLGSLRDLLRDQFFDVLHFMGHGTFDRGSKEGLLIFEDASRCSHKVPARVLLEQLAGIKLPLVVLSSCSSGELGRIAGAAPYSGVAAAFVRAGFPAVVAMQFPISDAAAIVFGREMYRHLALGSSVEAAVTEGRLAILNLGQESLEWLTPVLYLARTEPGG